MPKIGRQVLEIKRNGGSMPANLLKKQVERVRRTLTGCFPKGSSGNPSLASGPALGDGNGLNMVLVPMLTTAIPILRERFVPRMLEEEARIDPGRLRDRRG
jgi:hypothetical protein